MKKVLTKTCKNCGFPVSVKMKKVDSLAAKKLGDIIYQVECQFCHQKSKECSSEKVAIDDWNSQN